VTPSSASRSGDRPIVDVAELRRRVGERREVRRAIRFDEPLHVGSTQVPAGGEVDVDLVLESIAGGVSATGRVRADWTGECRRCLEEVHGTLEVPVSETFADQAQEGETYPIEGDSIDVSELARDAVLLDLPPAPLCSEDCAGPVPERFAVSVEVDEEEPPEPPRDPRWAALDLLRLREPDPDEPGSGE
jgi:uncharacterized protein